MSKSPGSSSCPNPPARFEIFNGGSLCAETYEAYENRIADIEKGRGYAAFLQGFVYIQDRASVFFKGGSLCAERGLNFSNLQMRELMCRTCRGVVFTDAIPRPVGW